MNNIKTDHSFSGEILLVEDDTDNLKYMSGLLKEANYQVRAANDGQLALRSIKSKLPDLILMDINMPGMNGVEVCKRLKSESATADIPVIFISAEDETDLKVKAFKAGGIDYVTKPIDPVEVLTRIDAHLNMYRLQNQLMAQSEQMLEEIKERIRAEQYLEENQLFLKASLESAKNMIILSLDQNYRYYFFNNTHAASMNHVFGAQPEIGKCIFDLMQGDDDIKKVKEHYDRALAGESHVVIEEYGEDNLRFYYEIQYNPMYNPENEIIGVTSFAQDITQLKKAESVLQTERDKLSAILDSMEDGVYIANKDYNIQYVNPVLKNEFGSYEGKKCYEYFHDFDTPCTFCKNKEVFAGKTVQWEWTSPKSGKTFDLIDTPIINSDGSISKLEIFRDITSRKNDQEQIKASLKEKEILLSEIHHRVKNNMQVIISLLRLQAEKVKDIEQVNMLKESENRVLSMATVHEMLYQSKDFSNIDFQEYVNNLLRDLFISYGVDVNKIKLEINCIDVFLDIENAIPCGLIINELVSNALKYAFPETGKGEIKIFASSINKDEIELTVSDDGVGFPKGIDVYNTESMGLSLVKVLSEETLEGEMELDKGNGTKFYFKLKKIKYKPRI